MYEISKDGFYIRSLLKSDFENLKPICNAEYLYGNIYRVEPEIAMKVYWELFWENEDDNFIIFDVDGNVIGRLSLQYSECKYPEIAIVIRKEYQNKGYGYRILRIWCNWVNEQFGYTRLDVRIDAENAASRNLFQKLGAIYDDEGDIIYCHLNIPLRNAG